MIRFRDFTVRLPIQRQIHNLLKVTTNFDGGGLILFDFVLAKCPR